MNEAQLLINAIVNGIQDKKGKGITIVDLTNIDNTICQYFIICQGNSPSQVEAIADSIEESARIETNSKPITIDGKRRSEWIAMDYANIIVHIFLPEAREFYDIEHLWEDAELTHIEDID
jgi:ribosome-associated protein